MHFELPPELSALQRRARQVAAEGVAEFGSHTDSWINGFSKEFSRRLAAEGWIGMTWPTIPQQGESQCRLFSLPR